MKAVYTGYILSNVFNVFLHHGYVKGSSYENYDTDNYNSFSLNKNYYSDDLKDQDGNSVNEILTEYFIGFDNYMVSNDTHLNTYNF